MSTNQNDQAKWELVKRMKVGSNSPKKIVDIYRRPCSPFLHNGTDRTTFLYVGKLKGVVPSEDMPGPMSPTFAGAADVIRGQIEAGTAQV